MMLNETKNLKLKDYWSHCLCCRNNRRVEGGPLQNDRKMKEFETDSKILKKLHEQGNIDEKRSLLFMIE